MHVLQGVRLFFSSLYPSVWMAECITWFPIVILKADGNMVDCYINKTKFLILSIMCFPKHIQVWNITWIVTDS